MVFGHLRNLKILTVPTPEVASGRGDGISPRTGKKMEEGLFLYGVHSAGYNFSVDQAVKRSVSVLPNPFP
jgi:hypothetical protein